MLHVIDGAEVQADDSAVVEIPSHDWKELNDLLEAVSDDPHEDMHRMMGADCAAPLSESRAVHGYTCRKCGAVYVGPNGFHDCSPGSAIPKDQP
jgi:hypothetical protein